MTPLKIKAETKAEVEELASEPPAMIECVFVNDCIKGFGKEQSFQQRECYCLYN